MLQLSRWFEVPRPPANYRPTKAPPRIQSELAEPIKAMIEENAQFGNRTVAGFLDMDLVQHIFHLKGRHARKCAVGDGPRIAAKKWAA